MSAVERIVKSWMWRHVRGSRPQVAPPHRAMRSSFLCSGPGCSFVPPVSCSPLVRHHDTMRFHPVFFPDPFCQVSNNTTTEVNCLLFPEALEDATLPVWPLASTAPGTESSFPLSPTFSAVPPGDPMPALLPEPFPIATP